MSFFAVPELPEWPEFLMFASYALMFLTSPWKFLIDVCSATLLASLVERRLVYSATFSIRVLFDAFKLVTAEQSSAVACSRLENSMDISISFFAVPVMYPPSVGGFLEFTEVGLHFDEISLECGPGLFRF